MDEGFFVYGDHAIGDELYAHRHPGMSYPGLGRETLTMSGNYNGHQSIERIGTASKPIFHASLIRACGPDLKLMPLGEIVGTTALARVPDDHLIAARLKAETEAIGKGYVPEKHTDFDVEHGWRVTMEMGRGG